MNLTPLLNSILFHNFERQEIDDILICLKAEIKTYKKNETIYFAGDIHVKLGLVLSGSVQIESIDILGNRSIFDHLKAGNVFAETYACLSQEPLLVNVVVAENAEILFLDIQQLFINHHLHYQYEQKLMHNLLKATSHKNLILSQRNALIASKTIRERLFSYLSWEALRNNTNDFTINFNRQQLADYLNVDRSALSNELAKMQKEELISFHKNHFIILK